MFIGVKSTGYMFHVFYNLAHKDFWQNTKLGRNFSLLTMGRTLIWESCSLAANLGIGRRSHWSSPEAAWSQCCIQRRYPSPKFIEGQPLLSVSQSAEKMHTVNEIAGLESVTKSCKFEVFKLKTIWKRQIDEAKCSHMMVIRSESEAKRTASRQHHWPITSSSTNRGFLACNQICNIWLHICWWLLPTQKLDIVCANKSIAQRRPFSWPHLRSWDKLVRNETLSDS